MYPLSCSTLRANNSKLFASIQSSRIKSDAVTPTARFPQAAGGTALSQSSFRRAQTSILASSLYIEVSRSGDPTPPNGSLSGGRNFEASCSPGRSCRLEADRERVWAKQRLWLRRAMRSVDLHRSLGSLRLGMIGFGLETSSPRPATTTDA